MGLMVFILSFFFALHNRRVKYPHDCTKHTNFGRASDQIGIVQSQYYAQYYAASAINTVSPSLSLSAQYNQPPICLVAHLSANDNQDLAEADQSIENGATNDENDATNAAAAADEHADLVLNNELSSEGAIGGLRGGLDSSSTLPDLAKVTTMVTTITNNSSSNAASLNCEIDYVDTDL